jgi:isopentenyl diphosphate isomerase/L-lactate dehydrogenase-like FMN-dependent dehydrogenase
MIARASLYGLIAGGEAGVDRALEILTTETDRVMGQLGCRNVSEIGPHLIHGSSSQRQLRSDQHAPNGLD